MGWVTATRRNAPTRTREVVIMFGNQQMRKIAQVWNVILVILYSRRRFTEVKRVKIWERSFFKIRKIVMTITIAVMTLGIVRKTTE